MPEESRPRTGCPAWLPRTCFWQAVVSGLLLALLLIAAHLHPEPLRQELSLFRRLRTDDLSRRIADARQLGSAGPVIVALGWVLLFGMALSRARAAAIITAGAVLTVLVNDQVLQRIVERPAIGSTPRFLRVDHIPSGHVTAAACAALAAAALIAMAGAPRPVVWTSVALSAAVTVLVGWASIQTTDHLALDVVAGALVAVCGMSMATVVACRVDTSRDGSPTPAARRDRVAT